MHTRYSRQMAADKVRYSFFDVGSGQATLAYVEDGEQIFYGVAFCAPSDNFCRETGKNVARRKLFNHKGSRKITIYCADPYKTAVEAEMFTKSCPQWLKCGHDQAEYRTSRRTRKIEKRDAKRTEKKGFWKRVLGAK